jgi:flavorubredoxin
MKKSIKNNVYWVGKNHWDLRELHGSEYTTARGSSYNSYLIMEEKTGLIDTVYETFSHEFIKTWPRKLISRPSILSWSIMPNQITVVPWLSSGSDTRHPGLLHGKWVKSLRGLFHREDWNLVPVKTGDRISVGNGKELVFIQAAMIHWPDSMFCYLTGDNILFSNDAFGQHYCSELLSMTWWTRVNCGLRTYKYYANIITPFSHRCPPVG